MPIPEETIEEIKAKLPPEKLAGILGLAVKHHTILCPYHPDKNPSMSCKEALFFKCFACGAKRSVIRFYCEQRGLTFPEGIRDLAQYAGVSLAEPAPKKKQAKEKSGSKEEPIWFDSIEDARRYYQSWKSFRCTDEHGWFNDDGSPNKRVFRLHPNDPLQRKQLPTIFSSGGRWVNRKPGGHPRPQPYLWNACKDSSEVFIFEGEGDVEAAHRHGFPGTTTGSCNSWHKDYESYFRGRHVVIVPDCDDNGAKYANAIVESLRPVCLGLKIVDLGGQDGFDFRDWLKAGGTAEAFRKMVDATLDVLIAWGTPKASWNGFERIPYFDPEEMLHWSIRYRIEYLADDLQAPVDAIAAAVIAGLSAVIGSKVFLYPKVHGMTWRVYACVWYLLVAPPGDKKTAILKAALSMLFQLDKDLVLLNKERAAAREAEESVLRIEKRQLEAQLAVAIEKGGDISFLQDRLAGKVARLNALAEEGNRALIVQDVTPEKMMELLARNPHGLCKFNDELAGFVRSLDKGTTSDARALYLEVWNGGDFKVDRKKGSFSGWSILSFVSSTQPDWLKKIIDEIMAGTDQNDGLIARFGLIIAHDRPIGAFKWHDAPFHPEGWKLFEEVFRRLWELEVPEDQKALHFDAEAQAFVAQWMENHHNTWRDSNARPALRSHMDKQVSLFCSLSIIFHMLFCFEAGEFNDANSEFSKQISIHSVRMAASWCRYIGYHVRKVYEPKQGYWDPAVRSFAAQVMAGKIIDGMSRSDILLKRFQHLKTAKDLDRALQGLRELNLVQETECFVPGGVRTQKVVRINPASLESIRKESRNGENNA
jgi:putative DNA primase/helicase